MKKMLLCVAGSCLLLGGALCCQEWQGTVNVPYDFVLGNTTLPAGIYAVRTESTKLMLRNLETGASALTTDIDFPSRTSTYLDNPNLLFFVGLNGRHVLHQVWIRNKAHGYDRTQGKGLPEPR